MRKLIFFLIVLVGFGVLNYPYLSSRYREEQQKQLAMELLEQQESEQSEPLELAQQYNEAIAAAGQVLDDAFAQAQEESGQQEDEEILGFVEIPKIEQYLPIYEGTSPAILNKGVGHLTCYNGRQDTRASGIGLYLCQRICHQLHHTICITSEIGKGTTVAIGLEHRDIIHE